MKLWLAPILFWLAISASAQEIPFDFKGVPLGISLQEFRNIPPAIKVDLPTTFFRKLPSSFVCKCDEEKIGREPALDCFWSNSNYGSSSIDLTVADAPTLSHKFRFVYDGRNYRLAAINVVLESQYWTVLHSPMIAKYGKPSKEDLEELQNGFGTKFTNIVSVWSNATSKIEVQRFGLGLQFTTIDFSFLPLKTLEDKAKTDQDAAKDFQHAHDL